VLSLRTWGDPVTRHVSAADLLVTAGVLAELAQRQEELRARLDASGLTSFVERVEWLRAHRSADEVLAEERAWSRLYRRHGVSVPVVREVFVRPRSLSVSKPQRVSRVVVVDPDRALQLALGAVPIERPSGQNGSRS